MSEMAKMDGRNIMGKWFSLSLVMMLAIGPVFAQEAVVETVVEETESVVDVEQEVKQDLNSMASMLDGMVSLDFRDADIKNVLKVLAYKSGVNIIAGPEVVGTVTIQLKDVPWQRALDVILQTYGYGYEKRDNIITVTTIENLKKRREDTQLLAEQESLSTRTFILRFSSASEVIGSVEKMITERGAINFDQRTNALIIRDVQSNLDLIETVIKKLDAVTPQIMIEAKIMKTTLDDDETLGIDWTLSGKATGPVRSSSWPFKNAQTNEYLPSIPGTTTPTFTYGTLDVTALQLVMKYLTTRTNLDVVSNPKIITVDNKTAMITVGEEYPIPNYTFNDDTGALQVNGFSWRDIGVIFEVTPHVNGPDFVTLDINPEVSSSTTTVAFDNIALPRINVEKAKTSVMVRNGETLMIAGLISDSKSRTEKKVPVLGSIPFLGKLFRQDIKDDTKTELMIFLTPHIITPQAN